MEDARGDAIKVQGTRRIVFRNVRDRVDRRAEGDQRQLRALSRALHRRGDRRLHGHRRLGRRHLRRPVGEHRHPQQHGPAERGGHRDRELDPGRRLRQPGHRQLRRHPRLHAARPAQEGRPALPRLPQPGARQQPRELRPQGEHRGDRPAGDRHHGHGRRPGRGLRQRDRAEPDRRASRSSAT